MKTVLQKIANAKIEISKLETKKNGKNEFSKYDYFTPSYVESIVSQVCNEVGLLTMFMLQRDQFGIKGVLQIFDTETGDVFETEMASAIPEIKATNIAQQIGGAMTYTERYMKMSAFGIIDNRLDFDTTENSKQRETDLKAKLEVLIKQVNECTTTDELTQLWANNKDLQANEQFKSTVAAKGKELKAK